MYKVKLELSKYICILCSQMHLDSPEALGVLNTLFETVAPSSLRPVDMLLKSMFTTPVTMVRLPISHLNMHEDLIHLKGYFRSLKWYIVLILSQFIT